MSETDPDPVVLDELQRFVVSHGLPTAQPIDIGATELVDVLPWAVEHRLVGLLHDAAASSGSPVPDAVADAHLTMLRHAVGVEVDACRAIAALGTVGVEAVVFKGVSAAHLDYPDPALRTFYDVDLLVRRAELPRAVQCLEDAGWSHAASELGQRWEERFARAVQFVSPAGIELDLHATLGSGYFGTRLDHEQLFEQTVTFELGEVSMRTFDADARLLASAYALVLSRGGHLRLVRDVAQQLVMSGASFEHASMLAGEGDVVIAEALDMVDHLIGLPADTRRGRTSRPRSRAQKRGLALARRAHDDGWRSDALGELLGLGFADRARYVLGLVRSRLRWRRLRRVVRRGARIDGD